MKNETSVQNLYCLFPYIHILCTGNYYFPCFKALIKAEDLILPRDRHVLCLCAVSCYGGTFMSTHFTSLSIYRTDDNVKKTKYSFYVMLCILQIENTLNQFGFLQLYEVKTFSTRLIARFRIYDVDITKIKN